MLNIAETNQVLFSMLVKQQNEIMNSQRRATITELNEEITQEEITSPLRSNAQMKSVNNKFQSDRKPRKKFKQAWELGLNL